MGGLNNFSKNKLLFFKRPFLFVLSAICLAGCTSSILQTADILPRKKINVGVGCSLIPNYYESSSSPFQVASPIIYVRSGLTDNMEIGIRTTYLYLGYMGDIKYRLIKAPLDISIGTGAGFILDGPCLFEGTFYLSKKLGAFTPYAGYRHNGILDTETLLNYGFIAIGFKAAFTSFSDFIGEFNSAVSYHDPIYIGTPYFSIALNFHNK